MIMVFMMPKICFSMKLNKTQIQQLFSHNQSSSSFNECKQMAKSIDSENSNFYFYVKFSNYLVDLEFFNFESFSKFKTSCIEDTIFIRSLNLHPKYDIILNDELNLNFGLNKSLELFNKYSINNNLILKFFNLKGLDLNARIFGKISKYSKKVEIDFFDSKFDIYPCSFDSLKNKTDFGLFKNIYEIKLAYSVKYSSNTCPLVFANANLEYISINGVSCSFVKINMLGFKDLSQNLDLNSSIKRLELQIYSEKTLSNSLLDGHVFKNLRNLLIRGYVRSFEALLFRNLENIETIEFRLENFQHSIYHSSNLIEGLRVKNDNYIVLKFTVLDDYTFPDEDICLFKDYPKIKQVYLTLLILSRFNCSCTIAWLLDLKNKNETLNKYIDLHSGAYLFPICFGPKSYGFNYNECNFKYMLNNCNKSEFSRKNVEKIKTNLDRLHESQIIEFIFIIIFPVLSFLGICSNLSVMLVFMSPSTRYRIKNQIIFHSSLNFLYCFIYIFHLINECLTVNGIFCSCVNTSLFSQYYQIYIVDFFGGVLKLASNVCFNVILLRSYNLIFKNETTSKFYSWFKIYVLLIVFGLAFIALNIDKIFMQKINLKTALFEESVYYNEFPTKEVLEISFVDATPLKNGLVVLFLVNLTINHIIFNLIILWTCLLFLNRFILLFSKSFKLNTLRETKAQKARKKFQKYFYLICLFFFY